MTIRSPSTHCVYRWSTWLFGTNFGYSERGVVVVLLGRTDELVVVVVLVVVGTGAAVVDGRMTA
ncbi:hypothetical protein [Amycolatopsis thermophila]|uniref:Uncharacterized protein n=1 Tax=Amycolatopsis thermophila TaxID=206084 RepID=A0ABU0ERL7_9PSEU|nr:hypothetical protein [Amycolatopsis thermophila]MDQ0377944.1 hypothetical protein [Amycolatopsis thermophila]